MPEDARSDDGATTDAGIDASEEPPLDAPTSSVLTPNGTTVGPVANGNRKLYDMGLEFGPRTCAQTRCITGGLTQ